MPNNPNALTNFSGTVRLFPLPNLVLFPCVVQPLHIFEPRYRQMLADALGDDRLLALALLQAGWEEDYHERPPIHPVVCVGRIFQEEKLADGRYNLLLHGISRARVLEELNAERPYRTARVELLPDARAAKEAERALRRGIGEQLDRWLVAQAAAREQFHRLLQSDLALGALCDIVAFALPLDGEFKQGLLAEPDVARRTGRLLDHLVATSPSGPDAGEPRLFPPAFSSN